MKRDVEKKGYQFVGADKNHTYAATTAQNGFVGNAPLHSGAGHTDIQGVFHVGGVH
jgi:hypothetical protein